MFIIKNSQTCGGKIIATNFETEAKAENHVVNHLLTWQNLADHGGGNGELNIHATMRRCGIEIVEVSQ